MIPELIDPLMAAAHARLLEAMPLDDPERDATAARVHVVVLRAKGFRVSEPGDRGMPTPIMRPGSLTLETRQKGLTP